MHKSDITTWGENDAKVYALVISGELRIDSVGQIWRNFYLQRKAHSSDVMQISRESRADAKCGAYFAVYVTINGVRGYAYSHRLVWMHFNGAIPGGYTINHRDGNGRNNQPRNLEIATMPEQQRHSIDILGNHIGARGDAHPCSKLRSVDIPAIRARRASGEILSSIAEDYGVGSNTISSVCKHKSWRVLCHELCRECRK